MDNKELVNLIKGSVFDIIAFNMMTSILLYTKIDYQISSVFINFNFFGKKYNFSVSRDYFLFPITLSVFGILFRRYRM